MGVGVAGYLIAVGLFLISQRFKKKVIYMVFQNIFSVMDSLCSSTLRLLCIRIKVELKEHKQKRI